ITIPLSIATTYNLLKQYYPTRYNQMFVEVGEWSLNYGGNAQGDSNFNAVWTADTLGQIIKNGGVAMYYGTKGNAIKWLTGTNTDWYTGITYTLNLD
ncbi:MAG: hypothetical protein M1543_02240, partial [Firmicutes bacterium]|nr:hypothetical protein [Bacillota bacterium]